MAAEKKSFFFSPQKLKEEMKEEVVGV